MAKTRKRRGRGEGSICQRANGTWQASASAGYDGNGKRLRRTVYGKTKREVQEKLRTAATEGPIEINRLTVGEFLDHWIESVKVPTIAQSTADRYRTVIKFQLNPHIGGVRLNKLRIVHVEQVVAKLRDSKAAGTTGLAMRVLNGALRHASRRGLIPANPCPDVEKPRVNRVEMKVWNDEEAKQFLAAVEVHRDHNLFVTALTTGMRQGELFALEWGDIDFDGAFLIVRRTLSGTGRKRCIKEPKSGKGRRIDLAPVTLEALTRQRKAMLAEGNINATVFCNREGGWVDRGDIVRRTFLPAIKRADVPVIRFHDLRHTHATLLLLADENIKVVSERLGHASIAITLDTYSHVLPTMQKAAADKIQRLFG